MRMQNQPVRERRHPERDILLKFNRLIFIV